jgi:excinuclease ABC subunit A
MTFFKQLNLDDYKLKISGRILKEINNRIGYLQQVGLGYLTLNRITSSLSGGEFQRIKLATSLGSALVGSMYILDEPSIGLHPRDTSQLIKVLTYLRDLGNSVIVVEHEEEIMEAADQIIDIGPDAGTHGGELVFQGNAHQMKNQHLTYTTRFLNGIDKIEIPRQRRLWKHAVEIKGARENNLKSIDVKLPLGVLTVITGVSGSGKSTLVKSILHPALSKRLGLASDITGKFDALSGDLDKIHSIEYIDQNPIGKSSRSNPVTYVKAYDQIRQLYSNQGLAKSRAYKPSFFSFNVDGGRCEECQGEGTVRIEMQFMADIFLTCENCNGHRFKSEVLEVTYKDKNISDVLDMTVDDAIEFFHANKSIVNKLKPLQDVGLGYIGLGQSSNTLSGGEAQRVKLASFLDKGSGQGGDRILFIFDEPTTGLHFHDIYKLLTAINALINKGHTVMIIEHNMEVIKSADWIIDLGPEGGDLGGHVVFAGTPEDMLKIENSHTAHYLRQKFQ